jgi:hypothetical protein
LDLEKGGFARADGLYSKVGVRVGGEAR